jgi:hypothetical protein
MFAVQFLRTAVRYGCADRYGTTNSLAPMSVSSSAAGKADRQAAQRLGSS